MCSAVGVSGQGAAEGVAGGAEHKSLVKRAFRRVCPQISEVAVDFSGVTMPATYRLSVNGHANGRLHASFADGGSKIVVNPVGAIFLLR